MNDKQLLEELDRLRREIRWLDASNRELWWDASRLRRLAVERVVEITRQRLALRSTPSE